MHVHVQYTTQIKAALGIAEETIEVPAASGIAELLRILGQRHAEPFRQSVVMADGQLLPSILLCVDDRQVDPDDPTPLSDGSTITFLSAISGG